MKKVLRKIKFIVSIKRFLVKFYENFYIKYLSRRNCIELLLSRSLPVYRKSKLVFKLQSNADPNAKCTNHIFVRAE